jgi:hypothetical protein
MLPHGSESWFRMEDGAIALLPRYPFHHALRLRLQEMAQRAVPINTDGLFGYMPLKTKTRRGGFILCRDFNYLANIIEIYSATCFNYKTWENEINN